MPTPARLAGVGVFVLCGLTLFAVGLFMIGDRQMAFAKKFTIYTEFAKITGLQPGALVRVSGAKAGSVTDIAPPSRPSEKFKVRMEIAEDLHPLVRTDSVSTIQTEGLVGGSFLAVSTGTDAAPPAPANSTITGKESFALGDLLQQTSDTIANINATIEELKGDIVDTIQAIYDTVGSANELIEDVSDDVKTIASAGARITQDAADISERLRNGESTIGKLINDDELYRRATAIAKSAEQIANDARDVVQHAKRTLDNFDSKNGPVQGMAANVKQTMEDARVAMAGFAENMEALKHNFFFRGFFNDRGYFILADISPAEYRRGVLTKGGARGVTRVWLGAPMLFEPDPDLPDAERLTDEGRRRLDSAIEPYLAYLGDTVLMVEGYSQQGASSERFRRSRARASLARSYLIGTYQLNPQTIGAMPLGGESIESPDNTAWDGIALAAFLDRESLARQRK